MRSTETHWIPHPSVTLRCPLLLGCGAAVDACRDACNRVVCSNMHQVPAWNEACESRCSAECQKGRAS